jgi:hypothetical protein
MGAKEMKHARKQLEKLFYELGLCLRRFVGI